MVHEAIDRVDYAQQPPILLGTPLSDEPLFCAASVQYVLRTQDALVLTNASQAEAFEHNPEIQCRQPKLRSVF